jgi:hypothetical protein
VSDPSPAIRAGRSAHLWGADTPGHGNEGEFTAGLSGGLDTVSLYGTTGLGPTWNVTIQAVDGTGQPTGPALATGSAPASSSATWTDITLSPVPSVSTGTMYAIVVATPSPLWSGTAAPYPGGAASGFVSDFAIRTYVTLPAAGTTQQAPDPEFSLTKGVAAAQAGPFTSGLAAPTGSTIWYQLVLTNRDPNGFVGLTLVDSAAGGTFPAACPAIPSPFLAGSTYTCTYSATVGTGTVTVTGSPRCRGRHGRARPHHGRPEPPAVRFASVGGGATITPPATDAAPLTSARKQPVPVFVIGLLALFAALVVPVRQHPSSG